jgi:hypothetical protein
MTIKGDNPPSTETVKKFLRRDDNAQRTEQDCLTEIVFASRNCLQALLYDIEQT